MLNNFKTVQFLFIYRYIMLTFLQILKSPSSDVDKGWAWVVLLSTFMVGAMTFGVQQSIGVMYSIWITEYQASKTNMAWITTLPLFSFYFLSPLFQIIQNHCQGYQRIGFIGSLFYSFSFLAASFATNEYLLFIAYSLPMGIGLLLMQTPMPLLIAQYFEGHLSLAAALVTVGSFMFSMTAPPIMTLIINGYDWRTLFQGFSVLVLVFCSTLTLLWREKLSLDIDHKSKIDETLNENKCYSVENENKYIKSEHNNCTNCNAADNKCDADINEDEDRKENNDDNINFRPKNRDNSSVSTKYRQLLSHYNFRILLLGFLLISIEFVVSITHIVQYAIELNVERRLANLLPTFLSGGSIAGRIIFGTIFNLKCVNKLFLFNCLLFTYGVIALLGSFSKNFTQLAIFATSYGLINGGAVSQEITVIKLIVGSDMMSSGLTFIYFCESFTILGGTIAVGLISEISQNYKAMFYITAASSITGAIALMFLRCDDNKDLHTNWKNQATKNYKTFS